MTYTASSVTKRIKQFFFDQQIGIALLRRGWSALLILSFIVVTFLLLSQTRLLSGIAIHPFETTGKIYVDSPEIYTRERLVNDRYKQDHWLRQQLHLLDGADNLLTGTVVEKVNVGSGKQSLSTEETPQESISGLPFNQEFRIRAAVRDTIRQLMLENMLDDRHDLTGNSVYALKFDTTVVPGVNTHRRAFVRIVLNVDPLFDDNPKKEAASKEEDGTSSNCRALTDAEIDYGLQDDLPRHIKVFYRSDLADITNNVCNELNKPYGLYLKWLESIEFRLNSYISDVCGARGVQADSKPTSDTTDKNLIQKALEVVLGADGRVTAKPGGSTKVVLSKPWADYFSLGVKAGQCSEQPTQLSVQSLVNRFALFEGQDSLPAWVAEENKDRRKREQLKFFPIGQHINTARGYLAFLRVSRLGPAYRVTPELIHFIDENKLPQWWYKTRACPLDGGSAATDSEVKGCYKQVSIYSGFFNFMDSISDIDAYSYTIFPKNDLVGIISDVRLSAGISQSGDTQSGLGMNFLQASRKSETSTTQVGFGDTGYNENTNKRKIQFGWVIGGKEGVSPMLKSQLALVSVPAWTSDLSLTIHTGWLDRNSNEIENGSARVLRVQLPPDFEAFDSFVAGNQVRRKPKILDQFFRDNIEVVAGRKAKILIPGFRLWRSTTVTLGAQTADRITVMPNMRGIIAEFSQVDVPAVDVSCSEDTALVSKLPLRIWTSEGVDVAPHLIKIRYSANTYCSRQ